MPTPTHPVQHTERIPFIMLQSVRAEDSLVRLLILKCPVLTRYLPRPKIRKARSLLQDKIDMADGDEPEVWSRILIVGSPLPNGQVADTIISYWHQVCSSIIPPQRYYILPTRTSLWPSSRMLPFFNMANYPLQSQSVRLRASPGPGRTYCANRC
jgi:hypothetical protein